MFVVVEDIACERALEIRYGREDATSNDIAFNFDEPKFDQI